MKKIMSLMICVCVIGAYSGTSFAAVQHDGSNPQENIIAEAIEKGISRDEIVGELGGLANVGIPLSLISINEINNGEIIYDYRVTDDITDQVTIGELDSGATEVTFYEDGIVDTLTFQQDDTVLLNGDIVTYTTDNKSVPITYSYSTQYSTKPLSGKSSDYTTYVKAFSTNNISLGGSFLASMTAGTVTTLIVGVFNPVLGVAVWAGIVSNVAVALITNAKANPTYNQAWLSFKTKQYAKPGNTSYSSYYKYVSQFYSGKNCKGTATNHTFYSYRYFH